MDHVFEIGIVLKGIDGLLEIVGGVLLLLVAPAEISGLVHTLTQHELSEDPRDLIASRLLRTANSLTRPGQLLGAGYLLVHGIVKVVLVLALLRNKLWAYPWLIGVCSSSSAIRSIGSSSAPPSASSPSPALTL